MIKSINLRNGKQIPLTKSLKQWKEIADKVVSVEDEYNTLLSNLNSKPTQQELLELVKHHMKTNPSKFNLLYRALLYHFGFTDVKANLIEYKENKNKSAKEISIALDKLAKEMI